MNTSHWTDALSRLRPCHEAFEWYLTQDSLQTAWNNCERGDWMLWLAAKTLDRKQVVLAACKCARQALQYVKTGEDRPRIAIEVTEAWCRGEATIKQVRDAAAAADAAAYVDDDAAYAAYAAYAASAAAADAAYAAADAATYVADDDAAARKQSLLTSANICRAMLTCPILEGV